MKYRKLTAGVIAGAAALLAGLGSGVVQAAPVKPAATPVTIQSVATTLPILGAPLNITFTTGPGGVLTAASIDGSGNTATVSPNRVTFTTDPSGSGVKVSIKSKGNTQSINARVDSLKKFEDPAGGKWLGVVFGDVTAATPVQDLVTYKITDTVGDGTGDPIVTIDDPTAGIKDGSAAVVTPSVLKVGEEGGKTSLGQVVFTSKDKTQSRTLSIAASVRTFTPEVENDDDNAGTVPATPPAPITVASLRITLSGVKALPQDLASLVGVVQTYSTFLCDSTPASFQYNVDAQGNLTLVDGSVTPAADKAQADGNKIDVRWPTGERVRLQAKVNGTQVTIQVRERIRCKGAPDPTITGASVVPNNGDHHGDHGGKGKGNGGGDD
jgi:hypothetical protein